MQSSQEINSVLDVYEKTSDINKAYETALANLFLLQVEVKKLGVKVPKKLKRSFEDSLEFLKRHIVSSHRELELQKPNISYSYAAALFQAGKALEIRTEIKKCDSIIQDLQQKRPQDFILLGGLDSCLKYVANEILKLQHSLKQTEINVYKKSLENDNHKSKNIEIKGLYQSFDGSEYVRYTVDQIDCLTSGYTTFTNADGKQAERLKLLRRVDSINIEEMEKLIRGFNPGHNAQMALEAVKSMQQLAHRAVKPMKK